MNDFVYVTDHSPAAFFAALGKAVEQGFYADDTIAGYPHFDVINEVKLTRTDKPSQRNDLTGLDTVVITAWHNTTLVLDVQDAILQGFEVLPAGISLGAPHQPHQIVLTRKGVSFEPVVEKAPEAPVSAPEADPVPAPTQEPVTAPEAVVEPPVAPKRKGGRPPKSKEL